MIVVRSRVQKSRTWWNILLFSSLPCYYPVMFHVCQPITVFLEGRLPTSTSIEITIPPHPAIAKVHSSLHDGFFLCGQCGGSELFGLLGHNTGRPPGWLQCGTFLSLPGSRTSRGIPMINWTNPYKKWISIQYKLGQLLCRWWRTHHLPPSKGRHETGVSWLLTIQSKRRML